MRPTMKGERTWVDNHGYRIPPHVSAITTDVVEAITRMFPLRASVRPEAHKFHERIHDVHFSDVLFQGCWWRLESEEEYEKDYVEGTYWDVEVCMGHLRHKSRHQSKAAHKTTTSWMGKKLDEKS
jgi:hypothetical protein